MEDAINPDQLGDNSVIEAGAIDPLKAIGHLSEVKVNQASANKLVCGSAVPFKDSAISGPVAVSQQGVLIAIAEIAEGYMQPRKVFVQ